MCTGSIDCEARMYSFKNEVREQIEGNGLAAGMAL